MSGSIGYIFLGVVLGDIWAWTCNANTGSRTRCDNYQGSEKETLRLCLSDFARCRHFLSFANKELR
jgi:hypothetical protein